MTSNNETVSRQDLWEGNTANLWRHKVTVHCYPRMLNAPDIYFHKFVNEKFLLRGLYNKSLKDWSHGKQLILFSLNLIVNVSLGSVSKNIEILEKQNQLFPSGPVIKCLASRR